MNGDDDYGIRGDIEAMDTCLGLLAVAVFFALAAIFIGGLLLRLAGPAVLAAGA